LRDSKKNPRQAFSELRRRQRPAFLGGALVGFVLSLVVLLMAPPKTRIEWFGLALLVVSGAFLLWETHDELWTRLDNLFRFILGVEIDTYRITGRILSSDQSRFLVGSTLVPVGHRMVELQGKRPFVSELRMSYEVVCTDQKVRIDGKELELAVITREFSWKQILHPALKEARTRHLGQLIPPVMIATSQVLLIQEVIEASELGLMDLLYPVSWRWLSGCEEMLNGLRDIPWLSVTRLHVNGKNRESVLLTPENDEPHRDRPEASRDGYSIWVAPDQIMERLEFPGMEDGKDILQKAVKECLPHCLGIWTVRKPGEEVQLETEDEGGRFVTSVTHHNQCRLWVKKWDGATLYMYDIPFALPASVKQIRFKLGEAVHREWRLNPAIHRCSFDLVEPGYRYDEKDQMLEWKPLPGVPYTPFLPGQGVTFSWQGRITSPGDRSD